MFLQGVCLGLKVYRDRESSKRPVSLTKDSYVVVGTMKDVLGRRGG